MVAGGKLTAAQCNFSHQDQIWKDYVHKEYAGRAKWKKDWGFLQDEYDTLCENLKDVRRTPKRTSANQSPPPAEKPTTPLKLPPLQAPKQDSSNPFPTVTSKVIGWHSGDRRHNLEVYGRWGRPKNCIIKQLKWPVDAVP